MTSSLSLPRFTPPAADPSARQAGLLAGWCFEGGDAQGEVAGRPLDLAGAERWLGEAAPGFVWLHFNLTHNAAERWLAEHAGLPDAFFASLHDGPASTRIEREEQALLAVVNDLQFDFAFEPSDTATLWICLDQRRLVTARRKPLRSVDQLRLAVRDGAAVRSSAGLLALLLRHQADALIALLRQATQRIDDIEDRLLAGRLDRKRTRLGALRRVLVRLQRLLLPEPAALFRLLQHPPAWIDDHDVQDLRSASEEFSVVLREMAALQERVKLLQEEVAAEVNERTSRSLYTLTIVTVLALPINIVAGLFGMNVGGIPLAAHRHGFVVVVLLVLGATGLAAWRVFRRRDDDAG